MSTAAQYVTPEDLALPPDQAFKNALQKAQAAGEQPTPELFQRIQAQWDAMSKQAAAAQNPYAKYFTPEDLSLPQMDGLVAAMDRAMKDGLPASTEVIQGLQAEQRRQLGDAAVTDVEKLAAEMSSPEFLEGFAAKCASSGLTEEQTHAAASDIYRIIQLGSSREVLHGMRDILCK